MLLNTGEVFATAWFYCRGDRETCVAVVNAFLGGSLQSSVSCGLVLGTPQLCPVETRSRS